MVAGGAVLSTAGAGLAGRRGGDGGPCRRPLLDGMTTRNGPAPQDKMTGEETRSAGCGRDVPAPALPVLGVTLTGRGPTGWRGIVRGG
jgi:hypothetical protein